MITHTNAAVQISSTRFENGVIFDNTKFVAGRYDARKQKFYPDVFSPFECGVASIKIETIPGPGENQVAIVTRK